MEKLDHIEAILNGVKAWNAWKVENPLILAVLLLFLFIAHPVTYAQYGDDRYPFVRDGKVGFIDHEGHEVIPPRFSNAGDMAHFNNGLAPVFEAGFGSGYIDTSGKFVIGPTEEWGWGRPFHEDIAAVLKWGTNNSPAWIDRTGKILFTSTRGEGKFFSEGLMPMFKDGKWGYVNKDLQFVIPPQYDNADEFSEGRAAVTINRKSGFIDVYGAVVIPLKYDGVLRFRDGLARVLISTPNGTYRDEHGPGIKYAERYGFVDRDGNEVIGLQFKEATNFSEGFALAVPANSKLWGVIDKRGNFVSPPEFESAAEFSDGLAPAWMKQKCGYIDTSGKWVIKPSFVFAESFRYGLARVSWRESEYGYINKTGKTVWKISNTNQ
jgi:hypothetical protein